MVVLLWMLPTVYIPRWESKMYSYIITYKKLTEYGNVKCWFRTTQDALQTHLKTLENNKSVVSDVQITKI